MDVLVQNVPQTDVSFLEVLAKKAGWTFRTKESVLENFIQTRPKQVALSDEDILEEVYAVRYAK